jgi:hypothetical protein
MAQGRMTGASSPPFSESITANPDRRSQKNGKTLQSARLDRYHARDRMASRMAEYRAYAVGIDGHIYSCKALVCDDDQQAIDRAKAAFEACTIEVWSGGRFVFKQEFDERLR